MATANSGVRTIHFLIWCPKQVPFVFSHQTPKHLLVCAQSKTELFAFGCFKGSGKKKGANFASCHGERQRQQCVVSEKTGTELWTSISFLCSWHPPRQPPSACSTLRGAQILKTKSKEAQRALLFPLARSKGSPETGCPDTHLTSSRTAKRGCVTTFPFCSQLLHSAQLPSSDATKH